MNLNTCNFIKRIEQVLAKLDISDIEEYVIIIIISIRGFTKSTEDNK